MIRQFSRTADMEDVYFALHYAAKHSALGIKGIAEHCGQREQTFRNKLTPTDVSHQPTLADFVMVMKQTGDTTPLDVLCQLFGGQFVSRTDQSSASIITAVLEAMREHGDIAAALDEAMADGVIDDAETARLHRQIIEARNALTRLENTVLQQYRPGRW